MRNQRSRLSRRLEKQTKRTFFISILGIIAILFFVIKFGLPLLINLSLFISGSKNNESTQKQQESFIASPVLDPLIDATNSASITISGLASSNKIINLYVNDELIDKTQTKENGSFSFEDIKLAKGENIIKTKAITQEKKESEFSNSYTVMLKNSPPSLSVESPSDGQSFSKDEKTANIVGKTDSDSKITINNYWAIVDESGKFSYNYPLQNGENIIKIVATDPAGNKTEIEKKINYSP